MGFSHSNITMVYHETTIITCKTISDYPWGIANSSYPDIPYELVLI